MAPDNMCNFHYIHDVQPYNTRSAAGNKLDVPYCNKFLFTKSFSVNGPTLWNSLPGDIRNINTLPAFKSSLKSDFVLPPPVP
jgi:hypothetical protein